MSRTRYGVNISRLNATGTGLGLPAPAPIFEKYFCSIKSKGEAASLERKLKSQVLCEIGVGVKRNIWAERCQVLSKKNREWFYRVA